MQNTSTINMIKWIQWRQIERITIQLIRYMLLFSVRVILFIFFSESDFIYLKMEIALIMFPTYYDILIYHTHL